ncbi:MAG TPA: nuclear transport factor 2 family protein [Gammaproteobacteria bacterium]|nr:nuclear transport factor 2 family protein [Gammaproteobacteria bacterium]
MRRVSALIAGAAVCASAAAFAADDGAALKQAQDRAAIEALMWRYVRALDTLDAAGYAAVFTEDGTFKSGNAQEHGRAELMKMIEGLKKGRADREAKGEKNAPMYHVIANHTIEFVGPNEARYDSYWMTVFGAVGQEVPARVAAAGRGVDTVVRVNGQWLIKNRDVAPK